MSFTAVQIDREDAKATERLELHALERMIAVLCTQIEQWSQRWRAPAPGSRETALQLEVFAERRDRALQALNAPATEPYEIRIARLEKLLEALDCSREYFRAADSTPA